MDGAGKSKLQLVTVFQEVVIHSLRGPLKRRNLRPQTIALQRSIHKSKSVGCTNTQCAKIGVIFLKKYTLNYKLKKFLQFSIIFQNTYILTPRLFAKPSVLQWSLKNHLRKVFWFLAITAQVYRYKRNHLSTRQRLLKKSNELLEASFAKMSSLQVFMAKSKLTEALRTGGESSQV